jgi:two-component system chemotaxis response regulator CheB
MNEIITKDIYTEYFEKVEGGLFISLHGEEGEAVALVVNSNQINEDVISNFIFKAQEYLKAGHPSFTLKMIGEVNTLNDVEKILSKYEFSEKKLVERKYPFEVIFNPSNGKLRASKDEIKPLVEVIDKNEKTKILIVDDSKTIVNLLTRVFSSVDSFEVVATAERPSLVEDLIKKHKPDVITLDIHMPEMNGVDLLKKVISPKYKIPTIMVTSISMEEGPMVLDALENGAFDYIQKPELSELSQVAPMLIEKVKEAAILKDKKKIVKTKVKSAKNIDACNTESMIVIGSSTGGTNALKDILVNMPKEIPPILIVQHIPAVFSKAFADRINTLCPFTVKEAVNDEQVNKNTVYIAPGGTQMKIVQRRKDLFIEINDDEPVNRFKPSVDYLFNSVVNLSSDIHTVAALLTGMGKDGAQGLKKLRDAGALTIAQNEESCIVFGMPREAIALGAAVDIVHLDDIATRLSEFSHKETKQQTKVV